MTLTPEQIAQGWRLHDGSEVCPIKDMRTKADIMNWFWMIQRCAPDGPAAQQWNWPKIRAYRIIEAHGADAVPARPTPASHSLCATSSCALRESLEMLPALWRSREPGDRTEFDAGYEQASGECADVLEQTLALSPARPTPCPQSMDDLVYDEDGFSQPFMTGGTWPEWLPDDALWQAQSGGNLWASKGWFTGELAIRVRRREPKRETVECQVQVHIPRQAMRTAGATIDLIDGKPDLSTLKIAEDAL